MGGLSEEREVSLRSGAAMAGALERLGYEVVRVDAGHDLPEVLRRERVAVAVLALHGPWGEDGTVQGALEVMGIPYTGAGVAASAVCMDKDLTKRLLLAAGVATPAWRVVRVGRDPAAALAEAQQVAGPWFVKPLCSGSSVGAGAAADGVELATRLAAAGKVSLRVLVERTVVGAELTMPILDGVGLPLIQVRPKMGFYDYANKYTAGCTEYLIPPADVSPAAQQAAFEMGLAAYRATGCRGLARVDLMVDATDAVWVLEINTIPGMTETSLAPKAALAAGIGFDQLVERILDGAGLASCGG